MVLRASAAANSTMGKWINKIPLASSMPDREILSKHTGVHDFGGAADRSRSMALGSGIQGGRAVSTVINSLPFNRCPPLLFVLSVWKDNGGSPQ
jgi:hypothetical protein